MPKVSDPDHEKRMAWEKSFREARWLHAFFLKCEGLTDQKIGERLGVSREPTRQLRAKGERWARVILRNDPIRQ
jgi:DNA-directed RNA polymerase sigma subunit (sigma70/sigma32)